MTHAHQQKLTQYRISVSEYDLICKLLGREPQGLEWALFSSLWSEHCSYKSSKNHLKKFGKTINASVVTSEGENAGIIDLGFGERIVFKMESHNHPSFIEPYQGAATGVGGILRDIFTMGARPIASADSLCFGEPDAARMPELVDGVVRGISGYGNCVGVPTVTGFTEYHSSYNKNILVNAMSVGLLRPEDPVALSAAKGPGNLVVYVGAKTGADGVHGAAMASESFGDNLEKKKPNVQIGDPYFEKLLIESCLQILKENLVVAIQDMGAAGLTSSSFEMSSKGQVGMRIDLSRVPLRDMTLSPEEILLSESQERMLLVCEPQKLKRIQEVFARFGLDAAEIGQVIADRKVELWWKNECLTKIDPDLLVENAPRYDRSFYPWNLPRQSQQLQTSRAASDFGKSLKAYLQSHRAWSRKSIYRQFDQRVGAMTASSAENSIAILRLPDSGRGLAIAVGCRPHWMRIDAQIGAVDSVVYPSLQMAAKGARSLAVTDCLNFGNPEKAEIMSEFVASVDGIRDAAIAFDTPVISGNVSFYNETEGKNITSTPNTGLIGLRENVEDIPKDFFVESGNSVVLVRLPMVESWGSWSELFSEKLEFTGSLDLEKSRAFAATLIKVASHPALKSSRVVGRGGLAVALAKHSRENKSLNLALEMSPGDLMLEKLYEVVLEFDQNSSEALSGLQKDFEQLGAQWLELGLVQDSVLSLGALGSYQISDLHQWMRN